MLKHPIKVSPNMGLHHSIIYDISTYISYKFPTLFWTFQSFNALSMWRPTCDFTIPTELHHTIM